MQHLPKHLLLPLSRAWICALLASLLGCPSGLQAQIASRSVCDFRTADTRRLGWTAPIGLRVWDSSLGGASADGDFLGSLTDQAWEGIAVEWIKGSTQLVYGSKEGLKIWDIQSNSSKGVYNKATGDWSKVRGLALLPSDNTKIIWGTTEGLKIWCTLTNRDLGYFNNARGPWEGFPIANHPTDAKLIIFVKGPQGGSQLEVWDTVANRSVGPFGKHGDRWSLTHEITRIPAQCSAANSPLQIQRQNNAVILTFPTVAGATYQVQRGSSISTMKDVAGPFVADAATTTLRLPLPEAANETLYRVGVLGVAPADTTRAAPTRRFQIR